MSILHQNLQLNMTTDFNGDWEVSFDELQFFTVNILIWFDYFINVVAIHNERLFLQHLIHHAVHVISLDMFRKINELYLSDSQLTTIRYSIYEFKLNFVY